MINYKKIALIGLFTGLFVDQNVYAMHPLFFGAMSQQVEFNGDKFLKAIKQEAVNDYMKNHNPWLYYGKEITSSLAIVSFVGALLYVAVKLENQKFGFQQGFKKNDTSDLDIYYPGDITTKIQDVAGLSGAKADMEDVLLYLQNPEAFNQFGAKVPKGILMNGAPGCGKTLLAKALAGEVNCPFINLSGSYFTDKYMGEGCKKIRYVFDVAQELAEEYGACIMFIDEIDALAQKRMDGGGSGGLDHNQTIGQLLERMDGLKGQENPIIIIGATNRADQLDDAVVRAGRFDRKVEITLPEFKDRVELLLILKEKMECADDINFEFIARITSGFSGAELANLMNEAAIIAFKARHKVIQREDIFNAFDNITLGRIIKGMELSQEDKRITAIHEAGHVLGTIYGESDMYAVYKATIAPRSNALGLVHCVQLHESHRYTDKNMKARIVTLLLGGFAEEYRKYDSASGKSSDIAKAHSIAYKMVVSYGMSEEFSYISYDQVDHMLPPEIATKIHNEVNKIITECKQKAQNLLQTHEKELQIITDLLMKHETVFGDMIYQALGIKAPIEFSLAQ